MTEYLVAWEIPWDADSPKEAARDVFDEFFGMVGEADHFTVTDTETGEVSEVNVSEIEEEDEE